MKKILLILAIVSAITGISFSSARAESTEQTDKTAQNAQLGFSIDAGISTVYNFRGLNVFKSSSQTDQHLAFFPSLAYNISDTGLYIKYWAAYQLSGGNQETAIDAGFGHEQDLILGYNYTLIKDSLVLSAALTYYSYPFASSRDVSNGGTGTKDPSYIEPSVSITYSNWADFNVQAAYFCGLQKAVKDYRYLYLRPYISRNFPLGKSLVMLVGAGFGYKLFNDRDKMRDNVYDVAFDYELTINATETFYLKPAVRGGWSNFKALDAGDEYMIYASLNAGFVF